MDAKVLDRNRVVRGFGRPAVDRVRVLHWLVARAGRRRQLVLINERQVARNFACHRTTIVRAIDELVDAGLVRRRRNGGRIGLVVQVTDRGFRVADLDAAA
jgi:DNA-binding MarR family transcriptional regulator